MVEELQFDLDFGDIRQYFPVNLVISGIFKICQDLFGEFNCALKFFGVFIKFCFAYVARGYILFIYFILVIVC